MFLATILTDLNGIARVIPFNKCGYTRIIIDLIPGIPQIVRTLVAPGNRIAQLVPHENSARIALRVLAQGKPEFIAQALRGNFITFSKSIYPSAVQKQLNCKRDTVRTRVDGSPKQLFWFTP